MTRFHVLPDRSQLWIEARSDVHPIQGQGLGLEGEVEVGVSDGQLDLSVPPTGRITLPIERLTSGSSFQDQEMKRRIDAKKFPTITAELRQATARDQPDRYTVKSDITFHGVARRLPMELTAKLDGDQTLLVEGNFDVDVRSFSVTPPRMLGLQVYPEVKIRMKVVLQPS